MSAGSIHFNTNFWDAAFKTNKGEQLKKEQ